MKSKALWYGTVFLYYGSDRTGRAWDVRFVCLCRFVDGGSASNLCDFFFVGFWLLAVVSAVA